MKKEEIIHLHELFNQLHWEMSENDAAAERIKQGLIDEGYLDENGTAKTSPMSLECSGERHEDAVSKLATVLAENSNQLSEEDAERFVKG